MTPEVSCALRHLAERGVAPSAFVVDVGAGDGRYASHSYGLIRELGWWGLLIEADERAVAQARALHRGIGRVEVREAVVGAAPSTGLLNLREDWSVNHLAGTTTHVGATTVATKPVAVVPLAWLLLTTPRIGVLSIDVEGMDTTVLDAYLTDLRSRDARRTSGLGSWPQAIITEGNTAEEREQQREIAGRYGYERVGVVEPNQVFVRKTGAGS